MACNGFASPVFNVWGLLGTAAARGARARGGSMSASQLICDQPHSNLTQTLPMRTWSYESTLRRPARTVPSLHAHRWVRIPSPAPRQQLPRPPRSCPGVAVGVGSRIGGALCCHSGFLHPHAHSMPRPTPPHPIRHPLQMGSPCWKAWGNTPLTVVRGGNSLSLGHTTNSATTYMDTHNN